MMASNTLVVMATILSYLLAISPLFATADPCAEIDGNWYCQPVKAIQYSNVGTPGAYNDITAMDTSDGSCASVPKPFFGSLSPLDEEVSFHFRGPLQLKQLAVYLPSNSVTYSKRAELSVAGRADNQPHAHHFLHNHRHQSIDDRVAISKGKERNEARQEVVATVDGGVVSWKNNYFGPSSQPPVIATSQHPVMVTATIDGHVVSWTNNWFGPSSSSAVPTTVPAHAASDPPAVNQPVAAQPTTPANPAHSEVSSVVASEVPSRRPGLKDSNVYERVGYYDSASQTVQNLVFLGNRGGQGSGVWDTAFGSSLSYIDSSGTWGASSSQVLADIVVPSDTEIIIMSGAQCSSEDPCGYTRPGAVAYHGFGGANKVFLMEFSMPSEPNATGFLADQPAVWILNANLPRTLEYSSFNCINCWESGCGEFDIAEALSKGSTYLKSSLHTNTPGGSSDYFDRPTSGTLKLAVVFSANSSTINVQVLQDTTNFSDSLTANEINEIWNTTPSNLVSHFAVT